MARYFLNFTPRHASARASAPPRFATKPLRVPTVHHVPLRQAFHRLSTRPQLLAPFHVLYSRPPFTLWSLHFTGRVANQSQCPCAITKARARSKRRARHNKQGTRAAAGKEPRCRLASARWRAHSAASAPGGGSKVCVVATFFATSGVQKILS